MLPASQQLCTVSAIVRLCHAIGAVDFLQDLHIVLDAFLVPLSFLLCQGSCRLQLWGWKHQGQLAAVND